MEEMGERAALCFPVFPSSSQISVILTMYIFPSGTPCVPKLMAEPTVPPTAHVNPETLALEDCLPNNPDALETADAPAKNQGNLGPVKDLATS
jgi:hypothetical protein